MTEQEKIRKALKHIRLWVHHVGVSESHTDYSQLTDDDITKILTCLKKNNVVVDIGLPENPTLKIYKWLRTYDDQLRLEGYLMAEKLYKEAGYTLTEPLIKE